MATLFNNMTLGITMNAVAEGLKLGEHYKLPEQEILNLLKVSTGDSWVVRNWSDVESWTAETALAVLLKDLKSAFLGRHQAQRGVAVQRASRHPVVQFDGKGQSRSPLIRHACLGRAVFEMEMMARTRMVTAGP